MTGLLATPTDRAPTVALDLETTGLDPERDRIIEIGAVRVQGADRTCASLVDPGRAIPTVAARVTGIDDGMVAGKPPFAELLDRVTELVEGAVIVGHKPEVDLAFLEAGFRRAGREPPRWGPVVCTLKMARYLYGLPRRDLATLARRLDVPHPHPHRALDDARATLGVYRAMLADADRPPTVGELLDEIRSRMPGGPGRRRILERLREAAERGATLTIDYTARLRSAHPPPPGEPPRLVTRRAITVRRVRPPVVEAWCHLRRQDRVFRIDRIRRIVGEARLDDGAASGLR